TKEYGGRVRRIFYRNTMLQVWNPYGKTYEFTQARIPKFSQLDRSGDWWFGKQGNAYIAYRVFGEQLSVVEKTDHWRVKADGISAGVAEIAQADEAGSFVEFKNDILSRQVSFSVANRQLSYQTRDEQGNLISVAVRYDNSPLLGRTINGQTVTVNDLDFNLLASPWVKFNRSRHIFTLAYPGYPTLEYNWDKLTITELGPNPCQADLNQDSLVGTADLLMLLSQWGTNSSADINQNGRVDVADLLILLGNWGEC
ncbi:MAG: hypothetical protein ACD_38C00040G0001, partial [uncultured bacterium]